MRADMFYRLLIRLESMFDPLVYELEKTIAAVGTDYRMYSREQKQTVAKALSLAGALKAVLDTPILTEDGQLTPESEKVAERIQAVMKEEK